MTKKRGGENEDAELWKRATETVTPLKGRQKPLGGGGGRIEISAPVAVTRPVFAPPRPTPSRPRPRSRPGPSNLSEGPAAGLDKRTAQRLKRGKLSIDGRIDLHGHTLDQALAALSDFIHASRAQGKRCLLVITGKGSRKAGGTTGSGGIRAAMAGWLGGGALGPLVLAFSHAQPKDGGGGAFYVLLRKKPEKPNFLG